MPDQYFTQKKETLYANGGGRPIYSFNPLDLEDDVAIGIMLPFNGASTAIDGAFDRHVKGLNLTTNPTSAEKSNPKSVKMEGKFPLSYTTEQQALTNLKNLLLTYPGERYMQPTFGVRIKDRVFEQNTHEVVPSLKREIQDAINTWLPYIIINTIEVDNADRNGNITNYLFIRLDFKVTNQGANQSITLVSNGEQTTTVATAATY
jgi:phage baseplate assembly protein W